MPVSKQSILLIPSISKVKREPITGSQAISKRNADAGVQHTDQPATTKVAIADSKAIFLAESAAEKAKLSKPVISGIKMSNTGIISFL